MWKSIIKATLVAGLLDITAAFIQAGIKKGTHPDIILKGIASGALGDHAFSGSYLVMALGLLFHFVIVFACALIFFLAYPKLKFLHHSVLLNSVLIAVIAWVVTTQIVIPLSRISPGPFNYKNALIAVLILIVCVGLPISIYAGQYYRNKISIV